MSYRGIDSADRIRISCHAQGLGEAAEDVDGNYNGDEMRAAFNATYLETGIGATDGDEVVIDMSDPQRPALTAHSGRPVLH